MLKEENVYEGIPQTEHGVDAVVGAAQSEATGAKEDSTVLGKFKDVDALVRAYSSLQAEFTRRSQRLKELEKALENFEGKSADSGAEKLRKNAAIRRDQAKEFDAFVAEVRKGGEELAREENSANDVKDSTMDADMVPTSTSKPNDMDTPNEEQIEAEPEVNNGTEERTKPMEADGVRGERNAVASSLDDASKERLPSVAGNAENPSEALYARASRDEEVRLRIIGEYLSSLGRTTAPVMTGGAGAFATPPLKAKTINDAGDMALRYFKKTSV